MILKLGAHVEVLNKDLHICTLDSKASINMTLSVEEGKGYVPAMKHSDSDEVSTWYNFR